MKQRNAVTIFEVLRLFMLKMLKFNHKLLKEIKNVFQILKLTVFEPIM